MKHASYRSFTDTLEDVARDIARASRRVFIAIGAMPLPAMLVCCVLLAFLISILPLALCLFVLFLGVKIVVGAFVVERRASVKPAARDTAHSGD